MKIAIFIVEIPFQEMQSLRLEVRRKRIYSAGVIRNNVIVYRLKMENLLI